MGKIRCSKCEEVTTVQYEWQVVHDDNLDVYEQCEGVKFLCVGCAYDEKVKDLAVKLRREERDNDNLRQELYIVTKQHNLLGYRLVHGERPFTKEEYEYWLKNGKTDINFNITSSGRYEVSIIRD